MNKKTVLIILSMVLLSANIAAQDHPLAPDFTLKDLDGKRIALEDFKGQVVFVNFWATWCPPCRKEIPGFVEVYAKYKDKGMAIIGVSLDRVSEDTIKEFVDSYKINYPIVKGSMRLAFQYGSGQAVPETFVIDKQGRIRHKHLGYLDKETLENLFLEFLEE